LITDQRQVVSLARAQFSQDCDPLHHRDVVGYGQIPRYVVPPTYTAVYSTGGGGFEYMAPFSVTLPGIVADRFEALALAALARARSPLAVDLLMDQPRRWRLQPALSEEDEARSRRLNRLIDPPMVVLAGPPNVGKSTLSNALLGRSMSIAHDQPGTTRDYTAALFDLVSLVVRWHDTPGLRTTDDPIEGKAIELAGRMMASADVLIAMTDAEHDWPTLPREADLRIAGKADLGVRSDSDLSVCGLDGRGLAELAAVVRDRLVPREDLADPGTWRFDPRLP
jgi:tRNA modification GTPase